MTAKLYDQDASRGPSAGDVVVLGFDREVDATAMSVASLRLLSPADSLGGGALVAPLGGSEVALTLGAGPSLSLYDSWRLPGRAARSPAAISVDAGALLGLDGTPSRGNRPVPIVLEAGARERYQPEQHRGAFSLFRGQMHAHTSYSDGAGLPGDAYDLARYNGLDWFVVTDHMEFFPILPSRWGEKKQQTEARTIDGTFIALWGYEWGHGIRNPIAAEMYNHANVLSDTMIDLVRTATLAGFYSELTLLGDDPIGKFNHPSVKDKGIISYNNWDDYAYSPMGDRYMRFVRVMLGSNDETAGYIPFLEKGWHVAPGYGEDNHSPDWGHTPKRMGLYTTSLTRDAIKEAMRARRSFTSSDRDAWVRLTAADAAGEVWMGSTICGPGPVTLKIECGDPSDGLDRMDIVSVGGTPVATVALGGANSFATDWVADPTDDAYYFVRVIGTDGDLVISAPIFVDR